MNLDVPLKDGFDAGGCLWDVRSVWIVFIFIGIGAIFWRSIVLLVLPSR